MPGADEDIGEGQEEQAAAQPAKALRYKRGLPVRKLANDVSKNPFAITFSSHGQPHAFEMDGNWRKLLHLPGKK